MLPQRGQTAYSFSQTFQRVQLMFRTLLGSLASPLTRIATATVVLVGLSLPALAQGSYRLQAGDVVQVEVLEDPSLNRSLLVLPDGSVNFPQVGTIQAGGRTVDQLRSTLTQGLAPNFASTPNVYVNVGSIAPPHAAAAAQAAEGIPVYVMGEVGSPGRKAVEPGTNLLQFIAEAGPLSRFAARKRIELHRMDPRTKTASVYLFDLDNVAGGQGRVSGMTTVVEGDVVVVPQRRLFE